MKQVICLLTTIAVLVTGCKKDHETPDQSAKGRILYEMTTTERSSILEMNRSFSATELTNTSFTNAGNITWTSGYATISAIKFKVKGDDEFEYSSHKTQTIDLFSALSALGSIPVPPGNYDKIEFKIKFEPNDQAAFELRGNYMNHNGVVVPLVFSIDQPFELKFELKSPTTINANVDYSALNSLALNLLMNGIQESVLRNAEKDSHGRIVISLKKNGALFKAMWNNFQVMLKVKMKKK